MSSSKTAALPAGRKLSINPVIPHLADELWHYECVVSPRSPINAPSSPPSSPSSSSHAAPSRFVTTLQHSRSGNSYFSESRSPTKSAAPPTRFRSNSLHGRGAAAEVSGPPHQSSIAASSSSSYSPSTSTPSENQYIEHGLADRHVNHGERSDDEAMVQLLRRIFRTFDENSDGSISKEELSRMFEKLGISSASQEEAMKGLLDSELFKERVEVDEAQFVALMLGHKGELEGAQYPFSSTQDYGSAGQEKDQDQQQEQEDKEKEESGGHRTNMCDNMVGHDLEAAAHSNEEGSHEDLALIQAAFRVFDKDQNGFISPSELQSVLCGLGFSQAQDLDACVRMIQRVDQNGDGQIDFFEFTSMITSFAQPLPFILSF